jgi:hypothetical protein
MMKPSFFCSSVKIFFKTLSINVTIVPSRPYFLYRRTGKNNYCYCFEKISSSLLETNIIKIPKNTNLTFFNPFPCFPKVKGLRTMTTLAGKLTPAERVVVETSTFIIPPLKQDSTAHRSSVVNPA